MIGGMPFVSSIVALAFLTGMFTGSLLTAYHTHEAPPMRIVEDTNPDVPTVAIEGIVNGELVGTLRGDVRLSARGKPVPAGSGGMFRISDTRVLTNVIHIVIPPGMRFVASKRGKKYHPVESASAAAIVPANRTYFPDAAAAERAGFVR